MTEQVPVKGAQRWIPDLDQSVFPGHMVQGFHFEQTYEYSGQGHSFQPWAIDLELIVNAGSDDGANPKFLAPFMGNLLGADLLADANYLGGVIGAYSVTGVKATTYPAGAVLGIVMAEVTEVDGAVVAVLDGDGLTIANAAFKARANNSTPGSGFTYGLDLHDPAHDGFSALAILRADIRLSNQIVIMSGSGAPVNGTTGDNFAGTGSMYIDRTTPDWYIQEGLITNPVWVKVSP